MLLRQANTSLPFVATVVGEMGMLVVRRGCRSLWCAEACLRAAVRSPRVVCWNVPAPPRCPVFVLFLLVIDRWIHCTRNATRCCRCKVRARRLAGGVGGGVPLMNHFETELASCLHTRSVSSCCLHCTSLQPALSPPPSCWRSVSSPDQCSSVLAPCFQRQPSGGVVARSI